MGVQCRCNGIIKIKNGSVRHYKQPGRKPYVRKTRQCQHRKTLAKHPSEYTSERYIPRCEQCGSRNWLVDTNRIKRLRSKVDVCNCGGYSFQHRKGSKYCYHHPDAEKHHGERHN